MKYVILIILVLSAVLFTSDQTQAFDLNSKLGVGIDGGIHIPASGDVVADSSVSDFFDVGATFGAHVRYAIIPEISVEAGYKFSFMKLKDEVNDEPSNEPYLSMSQIYLDGILNMGAFFDSESNVFNPYLRAGVGVYPWQITIDGVTGDAMVQDNGEEFQKTSLGLNFGTGLELFAISQLSFFVEGNYHYVFTSDEEKFCPDFDDTGYISVTTGLTYYFPLTSK